MNKYGKNFILKNSYNREMEVETHAINIDIECIFLYLFKFETWIAFI